MKLQTILVASLFSLGSTLALAAGDHAGGHDHDTKSDGHNHGDGGHDKHKNSVKGTLYLKDKTIDGYGVTFHIMDAKDGMKMGDETHHLMIKVKNKGKELNNIKVNSKVIFPDGKAESKMLMKMNGWYMAGYDLGNHGKHQMMILFKTADGKKHSGGVYYSN